MGQIWGGFPEKSQGLGKKSHGLGQKSQGLGQIQGAFPEKSQVLGTSLGSLRVMMGLPHDGKRLCKPSGAGSAGSAGIK